MSTTEMPVNRISIIAGRIIDPANDLDQVADLHIEDGKVLAIGVAPAGFNAQREIDASGQVVCPGLIDLSVRLREPGGENKATIASETKAAASAGITTLVCQPDTDPVTDTPAVVDLIRHRARKAGHARVLSLGALTLGLEGKQLAEMAALKDADGTAVEFITAPHHLLAEIDTARLSRPVLPIYRQLVPPWRKPARLPAD